jgi:D-glycerate 3-kinase
MTRRAVAETLYSKLCAENNLTLPAQYFDALFKTADWLASKISESPEKRRSTLGVGGAQGSGKSTFSNLLGKLLTECFDTGVCVLSLDDFYLTASERADLASISPMLQTRGVPGTHDLGLALAAVAQFKSGKPMTVPEFSKPHDDRLDMRDIPTADKDLLIFEGWCFGAKPQSADSLEPAMNRVEQELDVNGVWRRYVNQQLGAYQPLFNTDFSLFLKVPDFAAVKRWRWQQEQGLPAGPARMSEEQVERFILYYQRITEQLLASRPAEVDICLALDSDHDITLAKFPAA